MLIRSVSPLFGVAAIVGSVAFYAHFGFRPAVQWETYCRLACGDVVRHLARPGDPPPDLAGLAMAAPLPGADTVMTILVGQVPDCTAAVDELAAADGHLIELDEPLP